MGRVTSSERREVAARLRQAWANVPDKNPVRHHMRVLYEIYVAVGLNDDGVDAIDLFDRIADLIEPGPRAEEIAARAYRAAADYIDWELGDTPRVMALRERADELERMAHERDAAMESHEPAPKCSEPTPKCDRDALLALADEMSDYTWYETEGDHRIAEGFADRIRVALGVTGGGRRVFVERLVPAVDSRCGAGASRLRGPGPRATGGRRP